MAKQAKPTVQEKPVVETLATEIPIIEVPIEEKTELLPPVVNITEETVVEEVNPLVEETTLNEKSILSKVFVAKAEVFAAETIEDISSPVKARIAELEEILKQKWSGWRTQKFRKELEDLKSSM